ncbi:Multidrug efflux ATP-binding/permease protein [Mycobacterium simulans]|uniref:ABC transporter ATP-binding protein n=1 Tax=Mycobacterium simulans TaxID=627089 RepID=UPI00174CF014|nr:ABC transporter ATP-binding protein [Mycobacterium simulans]SON59438.1 Multidrug efflux ATP-binding/permease protein [Mycobacterium simulans]
MRTTWWCRLSGYVLRHRGDLLLGFGAALAGTVIAVLVPLVVKRVVDDAVATDHRPLAPWATVLLTAAGAVYLLTFVRRYYGGRIAHLVQHDLRMDAFRSLMRWDGRQLDRWSSGQLIVRTTNDLQLVQGLLFDLPNVIRHVLTLLLCVAVMIWLSPMLALPVVLLVPLIALIAHRSRRLLAAATECAQERYATVTGVVDAAVSGIQVVKAFAQEGQETDKLATAGRSLFTARLRVARLNAHFGPLLQSLPALGQMAVFALGGWMAAQGSITVGTFVAFWSCLALVARPACDLAGMLTVTQQARAGAVRVFEVIDSQPTLVDGAKCLTSGAQASLEFQHASFGYVADRPILSDISMSIRPGETLAVVGAPGSGKSTLALLATRSYDVTAGAVRIGGQDVRDLTLGSLRSAVGLVPEEAVLFSGTIGANIAYGRPDATAEQIAEAARAAHVDEFVDTLPDGYATAVGALGLTLSGGQRQRIALARALLDRPRLLILDDPTSAVDAVIESGIHEVLREVIADRTAIILTRRRSMLALADRVAVLESGRLLDIGTPDELWERCPRYRELLSPAPDLTGDLVAEDCAPVPAPTTRPAPPATHDANSCTAEPRVHTPGRRLFHRLLRDFRGPLALSLLLVGVESCAGLLPPLLIRHGIDVGVRQHLLSVLWCAALVGTGAVVVRFVAQWGGAMVAGAAGEKVLFRLRSSVFSHAQRLGLDAFEDDGDAHIVTAVTSDVEAIVAFLRTGLVTAVVSAVTLVGILVVLLAIHARLVLLIIATAPLLALATWQFQRASNWIYRQARQRLGTMTATLREYAAGLRIAQAFRAEYVGVQSYFAHSDDYRRTRVRGQRLLALYFPFVAFLCSLATTLVLLDGGREVQAGVISVGALVTYLLYVELLFTPIDQLSQMFDGYQQAAVAAARIRSLLSAPSPSSPVSRPAGRLHGEVVFDAVDFRYRTREAPALAGIDLRIPAGQTVVFVGSTGSGKSTLLKLVARFYDPTAGIVRVDGCDLREFDIDGYRGRLGIVPQEPYLFAGTVRDAIAYGRPDATDAQVERAAREVGAHPMITALDGGYAHRAAAGGRNLSAGQLQLLALARARLVDPDILLLDEATVALDPATEAVVHRAIVGLAAGRTTLIVAHQLGIAESADRVVVLEHGSVIEDGTHTELLAAGGRYAQLWEAHTQVGWPPQSQHTLLANNLVAATTP